MFVADDIEFAINLVNFAVTVVRVLGFGTDALLCVLLLLDGIKLRRGSLRQFGVAVDAHDLQSLDRRWLHRNAVRDASGVLEVGCVVADYQIVGVNSLAHRPVAQWTKVDLLERCAAEAKQQQHAVGVGIVFRRRAGQVVVKVLFQRVGQLVLFGGAAVAVVPDLDRSIGGQHFRTRVRLETEDSLQKQRVTDTGHTLDRSAVRRAGKVGYLHLQTEKLNALCAVLNPFLAGSKVVLYAA